jgi:hypothetical protein
VLRNKGFISGRSKQRRGAAVAAERQCGLAATEESKCIGRRKASRFIAVCVSAAVLCVAVRCGGGSWKSDGAGDSGPTPETAPHPPTSTRYVHTDIQYNPNALQFFPPHITAYDSVHNRFFVSNTTQNRIDVFDADTKSQVGTILVPLP